MLNLRSKTYLLSSLILVIFIFSGCAESKYRDNVIATVNGEPLYLKDFKRELALRVKRNSSFSISPDTLNEIMELMIDKKLIIQEAMEKNLAEQEKFEVTINAFWEQTLIRDFIDYKNKETEDLVYVTDGEIQDYYEKLKTRPTFNIARRTRRQDVDELMKKLKGGEAIEWDMSVSLSYEEIPSEAFSKAFELSPGQMGIFEEEYGHYLVYVVDKEPVSVSSLEELYPEIKKKIGQRKQQQAFNEWLKEKRSKSDIKIDTNVLQGVDK